GVEHLQQLIKERGGHYPIIYGAIAAIMELSLYDTLLSFYYNSMVCMVTNAVKLIPLGQLSGQDIIFEVEEELPSITDDTVALDPQMRGICAVGFDIASMQHERLYSRLYMS
ncbi:MAG: urease accessory UreF family protein, partial [Rikenellaceae bacterium]